MKYLGLVLFCLAPLPAFGADRLVIDPSHSAVVMSWTHRGMSNPVARLEKIEGTLVLDRADPAHSSVSVTMALDGLHTGSAALDKRLWTDEFLDLAQYPTITFKSTRLKRQGPVSFQLFGDLSVHGITQPIMLDARINRIHDDAATKQVSAGFEADIILRRSDFGAAKYVPDVSDVLTVHITLEANSGD